MTPARKKRFVGQAFQPDSESCQAGKPDLLPCRDKISASSSFRIHWPLAARHPPVPPAGNWLRFSGSIPPSFVLSHNIPVANTTSELASWYRPKAARHRGVTALHFWGREIRPFPRFSARRSADFSALCRTKCQVGRGAVWDGAASFGAFP